MRWIPYLIFVYALLVLQTTVGSFMSFDLGAVGRVGPDLLAIVAVFVALRGPNLTEAMLAGWALGLALDLAVSGGPGGVTAVGPMALSYALMTGMITRLRDVVFSDRWLTQGSLVFMFCLLAHGLWLLIQAGLAWSWAGVGQMLAQAASLAIYTGVLTPICFRFLVRLQGLFIEVPVRRGRSSRPLGRMS